MLTLMSVCDGWRRLMSCRRPRSGCRIGFTGRIDGWCGSLSGWSWPLGLPSVFDRAFLAGPQTRSEFLQGILDGVVTGPNRLAPGATAYVSGPHGTWVGSAGVADVKTAEPMPSDARMRIESNSKTWLVGGGPPTCPRGQAEPRGHRRSLAAWSAPRARRRDHDSQLMSDSSGLIDDNDVFASPSAADAYLARVGDPRLRAQLLAVARPDTSESGRPRSRRSGSFGSPPGSRWSPRPAPPTTTPTSAGTSPAWSPPRPPASRSRCSTANASSSRSAYATPPTTRKGRSPERTRTAMPVAAERHPHRHDRPAPWQGR